MSWTAVGKGTGAGSSNTPSATMDVCVQGDLIVAWVTATTNNALSSNDGFTTIQALNTGTGGSTRSLMFAYKVATAGQTLSPTWTISGSFQWTVNLLVLRPPAASPLDASTVLSNVNTGTGTVTATLGGRCIVCLCWSRATCTWTNQQIDASTSGVNDNGQPTTSGQNSNTLFYKILADGTASAGHSGTATFSQSTVPYMGAGSFAEAAATTKAPPPFSRPHRFFRRIA